MSATLVAEVSQWSPEEVGSWLASISTEETAPVWQEIAMLRKIDGSSLISLEYDDLVKLEDEYYEIYVDIKTIAEKIATLRTGKKAFVTTPRDLEQEKQLVAEKLRAPESWLVQIPEAEIILFLEANIPLFGDGVYLVSGEPMDLSFVLYLSYGGKPEKHVLTRERLGASFELDGKIVWEGKTLQGLLCFLQDKSPANPLPCALKRICQMSELPRADSSIPFEEDSIESQL
eukprot:m.332944 g.332944  ORF g.332944 m.332944 type:complete len:231 (-) comp17035_c0_seq1:5610-6302(-)